MTLFLHACGARLPCAVKDGRVTPVVKTYWKLCEAEESKEHFAFSRAGVDGDGYWCGCAPGYRFPKLSMYRRLVTERKP